MSELRIQYQLVGKIKEPRRWCVWRLSAFTERIRGPYSVPTREPYGDSHTLASRDHRDLLELFSHSRVLIALNHTRPKNTRHISSVRVRIPSVLVRSSNEGKPQVIAFPGGCSRNLLFPSVDNSNWPSLLRSQQRFPRCLLLMYHRWCRCDAVTVP
jgi:hypothetical protein